MTFKDFNEAITWATHQLMYQGDIVDTGTWQGYPTEGKPDLMTREILNLQLEVPVPDSIAELMRQIKPNLPWADAHFEERVSRNPSNPGKEYLNWPWWKGQSVQSMAGTVFDHTYQERFWPRFDEEGITRRGIRYRYGDLDDVIKLLQSHPHTRQATFPIFFPEDTGVSFGGRIPCTLHYHFMLRDGKLHMWYPIRSCDLVRHFRDDLYLACLLLLWVIAELQEEDDVGNSPSVWSGVIPGTLYFTAYSFHVHRGDEHHVQG